jgi:hypothetical protein
MPQQEQRREARLLNLLTALSLLLCVAVCVLHRAAAIGVPPLAARL